MHHSFGMGMAGIKTYNTAETAQTQQLVVAIKNAQDK
jgi:hypothetical protein